MIFETSRQTRLTIPMAISLGYGILFSTVTTLVLVPCLFMVIGDVRNALSKLIGLARVDRRSLSPTSLT